MALPLIPILVAALAGTGAGVAGSSFVNSAANKKAEAVRNQPQNQMLDTLIMSALQDAMQRRGLGGVGLPNSMLTGLPTGVLPQQNILPPIPNRLDSPSFPMRGAPVSIPSLNLPDIPNNNSNTLV